LTVTVTVKTEKVAELGLKNLLRSDGSELMVGWFPDNKYPITETEKRTTKKGKEIGGGKSGGNFVAYIASIHEFGGENGLPPARPFIRPAIDANTNKWNALEKLLYRKVLNDGLSIEGALEKLSFAIEKDIRNSIKSITTPALAESTVNARRRKLKGKPEASETLTKPLIDTAIMLTTLTRVIETK
jgi:hypothetical protein